MVAGMKNSGYRVYKCWWNEEWNGGYKFWCELEWWLIDFEMDVH